MNNTVSQAALIKRIRRALRRWRWSLVVARGDWYRNDQDLGSLYLIDANGNVQDHHCDLVILARDLRVLGEGEIVDGYDMPQVVAGRTMVAVGSADGDAAEVAGIMVSIGKVAADVTQVSKGDPHRVEMKDDQGHVWLSAHRVNKVRHTW